MAPPIKKSKKNKSLSFSSPLTAAHLETKSTTQYNGDDETENLDIDSQEYKGDNSIDNNIANLKRKEAKRARIEADAAEEKRLTSLLFGNFNAFDDTQGLPGGSAWVDDDDDGDGIDDNRALFAIDRSGVDNDIDYEQEDGEGHDGQSETNQEGQDSDETDDENQKYNTAAWEDEDDNQITVSLQTKADRVKKLRTTKSEDILDGKEYETRLRERFISTSSAIARTDWAKVDSVHRDELEKGQSSDDNEGEDSTSASRILSSTTSLLASSSYKLQPHILNVVRCHDANQTNYNESTVQAVQFHQGSHEDEPLMFTAGLDKALRFFKIGNGGESNVKIHGINCELYNCYVQEHSYLHNVVVEMSLFDLTIIFL